MKRIVPLATLLCLFPFFGIGLPVNGSENAAVQYMLAVLELDRVPGFVDDATTDHPANGFPQELSTEQQSYLNQTNVKSALARFDHASIQLRCAWDRYETDTWTDGHLNVRLHQLSRVVLLRARANYESGRWIEGNRDVERVRRLARRMTGQARFYEHHCFMIENMAMGTAAAYILRFPKTALADLSDRTRTIGVFAPMLDMLNAEAGRLRTIADELENANVDPAKLYSCISPYSNETDTRSFGLLSEKEKIKRIRGLSEFLRKLSGLMSCEYANAEERISLLFAKHAKSNSLVRGFGEPPVGEYRENAQGACRGIMFASVIDNLLKGIDDFENIDDPYGHAKCGCRAEKTGFTLLSELTHHSRISLRFGEAGLPSRHE